MAGYPSSHGLAVQQRLIQDCLGHIFVVHLATQAWPVVSIVTCGVMHSENKMILLGCMYRFAWILWAVRTALREPCLLGDWHLRQDRSGTSRTPSIARNVVC